MPPFAPALQVILVLATRRREGYGARVEAELSGICAGILRLLDGRLVPAAVAVDARVFYLKMKEDYHRYLADFKTGVERKDAYSPRLLQSPHTLSLRKASRRAGNQPTNATRLPRRCRRAPRRGFPVAMESAHKIGGRSAPGKSPARHCEKMRFFFSLPSLVPACGRDM